MMARATDRNAGKKAAEAKYPHRVDVPHLRRQVETQNGNHLR